MKLYYVVGSPNCRKVHAVVVVRRQCWELAHYNKAFGTLSFEPDGHLTDREYVVGDSITIADYSLIHIEGFKEMVPFDWSPYRNLNAYYERMRALPQWARTAPPSREAIGRRPQPAPATLAA